MHPSQISAAKVTQRHLDRPAVLYVRQSTLHQVRHNTESTQRQYALRERAVALGWPADQVRVIDEDLGKSGASSANRDGFRPLVASVAVREVGLVMGLEVSRLARNNADWQRLLELASQARTLILDETGVYDPHEFNDRILLGLKGQFSEIERFSIQARLQGGLRNKAERGALKTPLPIGLVYQPDETVALDPDSAVGTAVRCVFDTFERLESATATRRWLEEEGVQLPGELRHGPRRGLRIWLPPTLDRVLSYLKNPRYAGAYAWGRRRAEDAPAGRPAPPEPPLESCWRVLLPNAHPGYIDWNRFAANQAILKRNEGAWSQRLPPPRQGCALLASLLLCGRCGSRMRVHYARQPARDDSSEKTYPYYFCRPQGLPPGGPRTCQSLSATAVDRAVARAIVAAVRDDHIAVALAVQEEVRTHAAQAAATREERLRQLDFEADLAAQRYYAVNPLNRTVAARLEADWNTSLRTLEAARQEHQRLLEADRSLLADEARQRLETLAQDFSQVWDAPHTQPVDRQRLLATILADVTLLRTANLGQAQLRFHGGAVRTVTVALRPGAAALRAVQPDLVDLVERLAADHTHPEVAAELNRRAHTAWQDQPFTAQSVRRLLGQSRTAQLRARGLRTAREIAATLNVSKGAVRRWAAAGLLTREIVAVGQQRTQFLFVPPDASAVARILNDKGKWKAPRPTPADDEQVGPTT